MRGVRGEVRRPSRPAGHSPAVLVRVVRLVLEQHRAGCCGGPVLAADRRSAGSCGSTNPSSSDPDHPPGSIEPVAEVDVVPPVVELLVEPPDLDEPGPPERRVGADRVGEDAGARPSQHGAQVEAAPVRRPTRRRGGWPRSRAPGAGHRSSPRPGRPHPRPRGRRRPPRGRSSQPGIGVGVVVDERHDLSGGQRDADVARLGQIALGTARRP